MVLLPYPLAGAYDDGGPCGVDRAPGDFVEVPLGPRRVIGVVWDDAERPPADEPAVATDKLKSVLRRLDASAMRPAMRRLVRWIGAYTLTPPGAVLRMTMSVGAADRKSTRLNYQH